MAALSSSRCRLASSATSAGVLRHRASGRRRSDPRPEHGTSARTRSNVPGRHGTWRPSAATTPRSSPPARRRASRTRRARFGWTSEATRRAPRAAARPFSSRALPPGPAHRSSQSRSSPVRGVRGSRPIRVRASAASWLASSWTAAWPLATRGAGSPPASR